MVRKFETRFLAASDKELRGRLSILLLSLSLTREMCSHSLAACDSHRSISSCVRAAVQGLIMAFLTRFEASVEARTPRR